LENQILVGLGCSFHYILNSVYSAVVQISIFESNDIVTVEALYAVGLSGALGIKVVNYLASSPDMVNNIIEFFGGFTDGFLDYKTATDSSSM